MKKTYYTQFFGDEYPFTSYFGFGSIAKWAKWVLDRDLTNKKRLELTNYDGNHQKWLAVLTNKKRQGYMHLSINCPNWSAWRIKQPQEARWWSLIGQHTGLVWDQTPMDFCGGEASFDTQFWPNIQVSKPISQVCMIWVLEGSFHFVTLGGE